MKTIYRLSIIFTFLIFTYNSNAQREANIWYFGTFAGIDFNSGVPIPLTDGKINRWEGVASMCDSLGNLLMYTDGDSVWNAQHNSMPNGFDLLGDPSSTESAIIIPYPQNDSLYYIFTVDEEGGDDGLCYSLINMNLDNGFGDLIDKNIQLQTPVSEKVTAVKHKNNRDFWVISHGWKTDSFFVYLVTPDGINFPAQIYEIGTPHLDIGLAGNNAVGYMKASPDGSKLACALQVNQIIELYDFNNQTGEITNPVTIPASQIPYGVEFSSDVSKLYFTSRYSLFQADLSNPHPDSIINSVTFIDSSLTENFFGAVQIATDGKIYLAHEFRQYLGVINKPARKGDSCEFELEGFYLEGKESRLGLPDFIQTYFLPPDFTVKNFCFGDTSMFFIKDTVGIDSVKWNFGDTASAFNTSTVFYPTHIFSNIGTFVVILNLWRNGTKYIKERIIQINPLPDFSLGQDTSICSGNSIILDATTPDCFYLWNNLSTDSVIIADLDTSYIVTVTNKFTMCYKNDTIDVNLTPLPEFSLGNDTGFCKNDSIYLEINNNNVDFLWNTGSSSNAITVNIAGNYSLLLTNSLNCSFYDEIFIEEYSLPEFSLGNDTVLCSNTSIFLFNDEFESYLWSDSSSSEIIEVLNSGLFWLEVTDTNNCKNRDTIIIEAITKPNINIGNDTIICDSSEIILNAFYENSYYLWNNGSTDSSIVVSDSGSFEVEVTNICGTNSDEIYIFTEYCGEIYIPNIFTPNNDGINEYFKIKGIEKEAWQLSIFSRFGNQIFYSDNYKNNWAAEGYPEATYYYILQHSTNKKLIYTGFVEVYRGN